MLLYQVDDQAVAPGRPAHRIILTKLERDELAEIGRRPWHNTSDAQMSGTFVNTESGRTRVHYNVGVRLRGTTSRAVTKVDLSSLGRSDSLTVPSVSATSMTASISTSE